MKSWVLVVRVESGQRPGMVERVARIFAERGISLIDLLATTRGGHATVVLSFDASERMRDYMVRRLRRFEEVRGVDAYESDGRPPWLLLDISSLVPDPPS